MDTTNTATIGNLSIKLEVHATELGGMVLKARDGHGPSAEALLCAARYLEMEIDPATILIGSRYARATFLYIPADDRFPCSSYGAPSELKPVRPLLDWLVAGAMVEAGLKRRADLKCAIIVALDTASNEKLASVAASLAPAAEETPTIETTDMEH